MSQAEQARKDANNGLKPDPKGNAEYQMAYRDQVAKNQSKTS